MARKKETAEAMSAAVGADPIPVQETQEQQTKEPEQAAPAAEQQTKEPEQAAPAAEQLTLVYIGPSLPYGKMRSSMILTGTEEEINGFLAEIKEQYPEVTHLLVPPDKLTDALEKVARKGTILHKYYEDMLAKSRASRKG